MDLSDILKQQIIKESDLENLSIPLIEKKYCTIGGGLGSFAWVDLLMMSGAMSNEIAVVANGTIPYHSFKTRCNNSNIDETDRLRSDSGSTIDNLWGLPSYGIREILEYTKELRLGEVYTIAFKLLCEPIFFEPFTPRLDTVTKGIDREASRIDWLDKITSRIAYTIRKTDHDKYLIITKDSNNKYKLILSTYIYLATGNARANLTVEQLKFRKQYNSHNYLNVYESHSHVIEHLATNGGAIVIRGRGISASRLIEKIYQRCDMSRVKIIHLMRTRLQDRTSHNNSSRILENNWEYQHYNFPKSAFGGHLKSTIKNSSEKERYELIKKLGGTTTADRKEWREIINQGVKQEWYKIIYDDIKQVELKEKSLEVATQKGMNLQASGIIECTGLSSKVTDQYLYKDIVKTYQAQTTSFETLVVGEDFSIPSMQTIKGKVFCVGSNSLGSFFAPVDSFAGLQYAAIKSIDSISEQERVSLPVGLNSIKHWLKWIFNIKLNK